MASLEWGLWQWHVGAVLNMAGLMINQTTYQSISHRYSAIRFKWVTLNRGTKSHAGKFETKKP